MGEEGVQVRLPAIDPVNHPNRKFVDMLKEIRVTRALDDSLERLARRSPGCRPVMAGPSALLGNALDVILGAVGEVGLWWLLTTS